MNERQLGRAFDEVQAGMYHRFLAGDFSLGYERQLGIRESLLSDNIRLLCEHTYTVLTEHVGLEGSTIATILDGGSESLSEHNRTELFTYLSNVHDVYSVADRFIRDTDRLRFLDSWNHFVEDTVVTLHGPVLVFEFDHLARFSLEQLIHTRFAGAVDSLPGIPAVATETFESSQLQDLIPVQCMYIDTSQVASWRAASESQNIYRHEWWHVLDLIRRNNLPRLKNRRISSDEVSPANQHIIRALSAEIFDPGQVSEILNALGTYEKGIFGNSIPDFTYKPDMLERTLLSLQLETCANIAGRIQETGFWFLSTEGKANVARHIADHYLFFAPPSFMQLLRDISYDPEVGKYWFYEGRDHVLIQWLEDRKIHVPSFSIRKEWADRSIGAFLNPRGEIGLLRHRVFERIEIAFMAYSELSFLLRDGHRALFRLTDMPFTSWPSYVDRQMKLLEDHAS